MANTVIEYQEVRFDIRDKEITHCYVFIKNISRDGFPVEGWHYKAFPARMSGIDILMAWKNGSEDPVMWPLKAP